MIRVLHLFANLNLGGAESRIMDLYRTQDQDYVKNDFVIMTTEQCHFTDEILSSKGIIHHIPNPRFGMLSNLRALYWLLKELPQYDAIHAHTSYYSGMVAFVAWIAGIKSRIVHARNKSIGKENIKAKILFAIGKLLANVFATKKLAISQDAGKFLFGLNSHFTFVPNAFDFEKIIHRMYIDNERRQMEGLNTSVVNLVYVARFSPVKNHQFLLELMHFIKEQNQNVHLHLIGDGELRKEIERTITRLQLNDIVRLWGKRNDIFDILGFFDVAIMTSFNEGLGVSALEAQAAGVPCVLSDTIPTEADAGLSMCNYLSLSAPMKEWLQSIKQAAELIPVSKAEINEKFTRNGYTLESTRAIYAKAYANNG